MINIRKLEAELWDSADLLRAGSKLTSNQYCMPVLGLIFLRYAHGRFKLVEAEILKNRPVRNGRVLPVEASDFAEKSALYLPPEARYDYLVNLPESADIGKAVNRAMELIEEQSEQLVGVLPKDYTMFTDEILSELLRIFNNSALDEVGGDILGRIYEYFLNKFAKNIASDDGVFFTPKSLVKMIVNVLEPKRGILLDPACGSGGMFVQTGDFVNLHGMSANAAMTFYGQEKVEYNAQLCLMNMAVHGLNGKILSGNEANTFYNDAHSLEGCCDYVMANPPFNVDKVKSESAMNAGRLPFGLPSINAAKEFGNGNYLWISYFYAYLNEKGRAGFIMASSATDSSGKDRDIRQKLVETGHVDVMMSVGNNFFYTKSLPCSIWFFDKGKAEAIQDHVLFIDARNYYTVVDRTLNEWSEWQLKNLNAIVWLYRGEVEKYAELCREYYRAVQNEIDYVLRAGAVFGGYVDNEFVISFNSFLLSVVHKSKETQDIFAVYPLLDDLRNTITVAKRQIEKWTNYVSNLQKDAQKEIVKAKEIKTLAEYKRGLATDLDIFIEGVENLCQIILDAKWLTDKFGEGEYRDIPGLCKMASRAEIAEKNYSLTPGAYVGVAAVEDDGVDFAQRMGEIHRELLTLQAESNELMQTISKNMKEMGL
ncbi:MAG: SAM-dependent DNA methyltransferase [Oscillospiraceae bacterium]|nr:SAM-dependent DNA methyltransferase [Oscillospiraceae bacterium]